jgi:hypothetical protein
VTVQQLREAKKKKYDEFYTRYQEIEAEVNAYLDYDPDTFANKTVLLPCYDPEWRNFTFVLDHDINKNGRIDIDDIQWSYLNSDGDFRSDEVTKLRDEADIICTNPPFSLFREFFKWINEFQKKYIILGNISAIGYKEIFPFFKENKTWLGAGTDFRGHTLYLPDNCPLLLSKCRVDSENGRRCVLMCNLRWFTNIDHGRRHEPLILMTKADNLRYSKHKEIRGKSDYEHYDNLDAIEVPFVDAIPSDYDGVMGVPISFLDKYCPEQFEVIGSKNGWDLQINGRHPFRRILIKRKVSVS